MPGPRSRATTTRPKRPSSYTGLSSISPWPTWTTMFLAISEIAVAISVASVRENPSSAASARPRARAVTRSPSEPIATRTPSSAILFPLSDPEQSERFVEVERGLERLQVEVELHHGDRDVGLDADDDRGGAAKSGRD